MTPNLSDQPQPASEAPGAPTRTDNLAAAEAERRRLHNLQVRAWHAFYRDLAGLLKDRYRQWVAYHGDQQLGFARTQTELYQECLRRGFQRGEFVVCSIEPADPDFVIDELLPE
ncbi:MAG: hypothetical protein L0Z62_10115 [Gemmataceae bacterium]|nr:hypothetical protein [Gemmataceae bacterium]